MIFERRRRHSFCAGVYAFFAFVRRFVPRGQHGPSSICIRWKKKTTDGENKRRGTPPKIKTAVKIEADPFLFFGCFLSSELGDVHPTPPPAQKPRARGEGAPRDSFVNAQFRLECIWLSSGVPTHDRPTCCRRRVQYPFMISSPTTVRKTETNGEGEGEGRKTVAFRIRYVYDVHTSYTLCTR